MADHIADAGKKVSDHSALIERLEAGCIFHPRHYWIVEPDKTDALLAEAAAALRDQQELIAATRGYFNGWMQDEAEDGAPEWVGCSVEQHEAARRVRDALPSAPDQAKALK